jgi:hypothetical protein
MFFLTKHMFPHLEEHPTVVLDWVTDAWSLAQQADPRRVFKGLDLKRLGSLVSCIFLLQIRCATYSNYASN